MLSRLRLGILLAVMIFVSWLSWSWYKVNQHSQLGTWHDNMATSWQNGKYGYVNNQYELVIPHQFDIAKPFIDGRAITGMTYGSGYKYHLIDKQGNYIGQFYDEIGALGEGLYRVRNNIKGKNSSDSDYYQWQLMNGNGNIISQKRYHIMDSFQNGRARVCIYQRCGFIDQTGNEIILLGNASNQERYSHVYDSTDDDTEISANKPQGFNQELSRSFDNGLVGFRNTQGTLVINHQFLDAKNFSDDVAVVRTKQGIGVIDSTGNFVLRPTSDYDEIDAFSHQVAIVNKDKQTGIITKTGKLVVPLGKYSFIGRFDQTGTANISKNGLYGVIDSTGKEIIPPIYQETFGDFNDGIIEAVKADNPTVLLHLNKHHQIVGKSKLTISN